MEVAEEVCGGNMVITLEGGYNLEGQALSVKEVVKRMAGEDLGDRGAWEEQEAQAYPRVRAIVKAIKENLRDHWQWEG